ncbi:ribosomal L24 [Brachionus plicatilis]|uniref:Large ribosomal subunit protein eL24 n=1 Tax=Brachionus plicatilis TaxID=10195 RepID=A0A3M7P6K3_BRAPC|nr:ribosomal L24 [Brachionus plicatilis]
MKTELCIFSGFKIYPGHGKRVVKPDLRTLVFISRKCEASYNFKRNPRSINWTVLYRRKHKKGQVEIEAKKKSRRLAKFQRAITGATLEDIMKKRNQKPEVRKAEREQAIRAAKELKKAKASTKKPTVPSQVAAKKVQAKQQMPKASAKPAAKPAKIPGLR